MYSGTHEQLLKVVREFLARVRDVPPDTSVGIDFNLQVVTFQAKGDKNPAPLRYIEASGTLGVDLNPDLDPKCNEVFYTEWLAQGVAYRCTAQQYQDFVNKTLQEYQATRSVAKEDIAKDSTPPTPPVTQPLPPASDTREQLRGVVREFMARVCSVPATTHVVVSENLRVVSYEGVNWSDPLPGFIREPGTLGADLNPDIDQQVLENCHLNSLCHWVHKRCHELRVQEYVSKALQVPEKSR